MPITVTERSAYTPDECRACFLEILENPSIDLMVVNCVNGLRTDICQARMQSKINNRNLNKLYRTCARKDRSVVMIAKRIDEVDDYICENFAMVRSTGKYSKRATVHRYSANPCDPAKVWALHDAGWSDTAIAEDFFRPVSDVRRILSGSRPDMCTRTHISNELLKKDKEREDGVE